VPHVDGDPSRFFHRHHDVDAAFAKLRMTEHDLMVPERLRQIAEWGLADASAVDEDLGPGNRVDAQWGSWQVNG
jgi:hypothetical protein